jgi:serine/threonine protein kinase
MSQVVCSLEFLHDRTLIYRDLKPENILVQRSGYLKLADFGFIKKLPTNERTYTFCGTPEYIAPEIIQNKGYGAPVDWYASGIFMFEMLYGRPPFMSADPYNLF